MTSDTDLPHQQDTLLESRLTEKKNKSNNKIIFVLISIINLFLIKKFFESLEVNSIGDIFHPVLPLILLGGIDFVAALAYIVTKHSQGGPSSIARRVIADAVLIFGVLTLAIAVIIIYTIFGLLSVFH